jgi:putative DNA-invertase from lambdoid prophage Rac
VSPRNPTSSKPIDLIGSQSQAPTVPVRSPSLEPRPIRIEMPGKVARHLTGCLADLGETERHALQQGREVRRGQGYSLHVTAPPHVHQALQAAAETVGESASAADRKAFRIYRDRLNAATT